MKINIKKLSGFTLIEILIALFIFTLMSLIATGGLRAVMENRQRLKTQTEQLASLQMAMALIRQDLSQIIDRPVHNLQGERQPDTIFTDTQLEFTRAGYFNPLEKNQSNLRRINYSLTQEGLVRNTWETLDPAVYHKISSRLLISQITQFSWYYLDTPQEKFTSWPPLNKKDPTKKFPAFPKAIMLEMELSPWGKFQTVFMIKAGSLNES